MRADITVLYDATGQRIAKPTVLEGAGLDLDEQGNAYIFGPVGSGANLAGRLQHAGVAFVSKDGLLIRGFEEAAPDRFIRQEWWVRPREAAC